LYGEAKDADGVEMDPLLLMHKMREEEGLAMKHSVLGIRQNAPAANQELLDEDSDEEKKIIPGSSRSNGQSKEDPEAEFLKSLTLKQKEKLLRKLERLEKKSKKSKKDKKKKSKSKSKDRDDKDRKRGKDRSRSDEKSSRDKDKSSSRKRRHSSSSSSSSNSKSSEERDRDRRSKKHRKH